MGPPRLGSQVGYWVQYKLISVEVEMRTIEISSPSFRIHRGRLDNVMKIYISKLLPKFLSKNIFKNFEKNRKIFSFSRFRKSEKSEKIEIFRNLKKIQIFRFSRYFQMSKIGYIRRVQEREESPRSSFFYKRKYNYLSKKKVEPASSPQIKFK